MPRILPSRDDENKIKGEWEDGGVERIETSDSVLGGDPEQNNQRHSPPNYAFREIVERLGYLYNWINTVANSIVTVARATTTAEGVARLATIAEVLKGTDDSTIVTPETLQAKINDIPEIPDATEDIKGKVELISQGEARTATDLTRAVTIGRLLDALQKGSAFQATEANRGVASVATLSDVNGGSNDTDMITALKLNQWVNQRLISIQREIGTVPFPGQSGLNNRSLVIYPGGDEIWRLDRLGTNGVRITRININDRSVNRSTYNLTNIPGNNGNSDYPGVYIGNDEFWIFSRTRGLTFANNETIRVSRYSASTRSRIGTFDFTANGSGVRFSTYTGNDEIWIIDQKIRRISTTSRTIVGEFDLPLGIYASQVKGITYVGSNEVWINTPLGNKSYKITRLDVTTRSVIGEFDYEASSASILDSVYIGNGLIWFYEYINSTQFNMFQILNTNILSFPNH